MAHVAVELALLTVNITPLGRSGATNEASRRIDVRDHFYVRSSFAHAVPAIRAFFKSSNVIKPDRSGFCQSILLVGHPNRKTGF
jgi:hypothetical protein